MPTSRSILAVALVAAVSGYSGKSNTWELVGETGASAQQMFLGTETTLYIVDKTENNPASIGGHPAWATEYDISSNTYRALDIQTNSFCAGGNLMGNGSWLSVGGNNAIGRMGVSDKSGSGPYKDLSGGRATRVIDPCGNRTCNWSEDVDGMPLNRWYPTLETVEDGSVMIIGGELWGGFVNSVSQKQSEATYEYWPTKGAPIKSKFLQDTQPANLYPLTFMLPSGLIFMQASWSTTLLDRTTGIETRLPNIPIAQKTYPASGAIAMLPLTVENNFKPTLLFCGGMTPERDDWNQTLWAIAETDTSSSCVSINPLDAAPTWVNDDNLPQNRGMGNFIILPDQRLFLANGVAKGAAGYGWESWAINQSYAQNPVLSPAYYTPTAEPGKRFDTALPASSIGRLYHSTASLLPDGSVFIAGSNPNADMINEANNASYVFKTEYRAEKYYPSYYDEPRPLPSGIPKSVGYGGAGFDLMLSASSINGADLTTIKVALIRTGYSTHGMNMGQRYVQLVNTFTGAKDGSATLHVSQLPPNPSILAPGPALLFVVRNGVPSIGVFVMVGSGQLGPQPTAAVTPLPPSTSNVVQRRSLQEPLRFAKRSTSSTMVAGRTGAGALTVVAAVTLFLLY